MQTTFLLATAQLGAVLAGFAGLVGSLRGAKSEWHPMDHVALTFIIRTAFAALFASLLPILIENTLNDLETSIRVSSAVLSIMLIAIEFGSILRMRQQHIRLRRRAWGVGLTLVNPLVAILLILNGLVFGSFATYAWGIGWALFMPAVQFLILVVVTTEIEGRAK